jgi:hypothetical protein
MHHTYLLLQVVHDDLRVVANTLCMKGVGQLLEHAHRILSREGVG